MATLAEADIRFPDPTRPAVNPWFIALTVMLATFMEVLDTSIANVALPHIPASLLVAVYFLHQHSCGPAVGVPHDRAHPRSAPCHRREKRGTRSHRLHRPWPAQRRPGLPPGGSRQGPAR